MSSDSPMKTVFFNDSLQRINEYEIELFEETLRFPYCLTCSPMFRSSPTTLFRQNIQQYTCSSIQVHNGWGAPITVHLKSNKKTYKKKRINFLYI